MKWNWIPHELKPEFLSEWESIRKHGKWRFVVVRGIIVFGGLLFIVWSAISYAVGFGFQFIGKHIVCSVLAGLILGLFGWHRAERSYRRRETASGSG
jgi:hypothetical protein